MSYLSANMYTLVIIEFQLPSCYHDLLKINTHDVKAAVQRYRGLIAPPSWLCVRDEIGRR